MKRFTLLLTSLITAYSASAQPQISAAEYNPTQIASVSYKYGSGQTAIAPCNAGANVTWNLSAWSLSSDLNYTIAACPGSPECGNFTDATEYFDGSLANVFYAHTTDAWEQVGEQSASGSIIAFTDPYKFLQFPVTYQQSFNDNFAMSGPDFIRQGSINSIIDGYGTLITPHGTYHNVLRQKLTETSTMSTQGASLNYIITQYNWYQANAHHQIATLTITEASIPDVPAPIPTVYVTTYSTNDVGSAIKETEGLQALVSLYPNPAYGKQLTISSPGLEIDRVDLVDIMGKTVYSSQETKGSTAIVQVAGLAAGMYAARIYTNKGIVSKKVMVQ